MRNLIWHMKTFFNIYKEMFIWVALGIGGGYLLSFSLQVFPTTKDGYYILAENFSLIAILLTSVIASVPIWHYNKIVKPYIKQEIKKDGLARKYKFFQNRFTR